MELLVSVAQKLCDLVKAKFEEDIKDRRIPLSKLKFESAFWNVTYKHQSLFRSLIGDFEPLYLRDKIKYKKDRHYLVSEHLVLKFGEEEYLKAFLNYLGYQDEELSNQFDSFLEEVDPEERLFQQKYLNTPAHLKSEKTRLTKEGGIGELAENNAKLMSRRYAPRLSGAKFWMFFYGYDKLKGVPIREKGVWPLVKLLLTFTEMSGYNIKVDIRNNGDPEHFDYSGQTDFLTSSEQVLVINCRTNPDFTRQLNIKINIGNANGSMMLGQFCNYENDGRIISGNILLQRITGGNIELKPKVHMVPKLLPGEKMYKEDFEEIDKSILQYLHNKDMNIMRTSIRAGHSLESLENWLKVHNPNETT